MSKMLNGFATSLYVFSDVFGKSSSAITHYMIDHPGETFDVAPFVDGRRKSPVAEIQAAVDGAISPEQAVKLRQCLAHIEELEGHRNEIEQAILLIAEPYSAVLDLLYTLPGLDKNPMTAIWNMLSKLEPYNSEGFLEHRPVNEKKVLTKAQALELFRKRGYTIVDDATVTS